MERSNAASELAEAGRDGRFEGASDDDKWERREGREEGLS